MLDATLTADPTPDSIELAFTVENSGPDDVSLSFSDGQRAEFVAERGGDEVWRWGADRMFTMAVESEELAPGERATYRATWPDVQRGEYAVRAWLTATDADAEAATTVVVD